VLKKNEYQKDVEENKCRALAATLDRCAPKVKRWVCGPGGQVAVKVRMTIVLCRGVEGLDKHQQKGKSSY
jgi:hypothetical protein